MNDTPSARRVRDRHVVATRNALAAILAAGYVRSRKSHDSDPDSAAGAQEQLDSAPRESPDHVGRTA